MAKIKKSSFEGCNSIASIIIDPENTVYDSRNDCNAIIETSSNTILFGCKNTVIPNNVTSIGNNAFENCSLLTSIEIPESVSNIGYDAFSGCSSLTSIKIPNSVTDLGSYAFKECRSLASVSIGNSVTSIGQKTFYDCSSLTDVKIGKNVLSIYKSAFDGCRLLKSLSIGKKVEFIDEDAFFRCSSLSSITVDSANSVYNSRDNCNAIIETSSNKLILGCKNTVIPNGVTSIERTAFYDCSSLTGITIPDSVTSIGDSAFSGCSSLTSITLGKNVTSIGYWAFYGCTSITSVTFDKNLKKIKYGAFSGCKALKDVYYKGSEADWKKVKNDSEDECLSNAKLHYEIKSLQKASVSGIENKTYTGKAITQKIVVKLGSKTLKKGTDYTVSYKNNKNVGSATVTVKGKGKYCGTIKKAFKINPKGSSVSKASSPKSKQIKVVWKKQPTQTTGYQIQYSTSSKFTSKTTKTITVSSNKTTSKTISKLKGKKKYYVRIRTYKTVEKTKYYSAWSKSKSVTTKK